MPIPTPTYQISRKIIEVKNLKIIEVIVVILWRRFIFRIDPLHLVFPCGDQEFAPLQKAKKDRAACVPADESWGGGGEAPWSFTVNV